MLSAARRGGGCLLRLSRTNTRRTSDRLTLARSRGPSDGRVWEAPAKPPNTMLGSMFAPVAGTNLTYLPNAKFLHSWLYT